MPRRRRRRNEKELASYGMAQMEDTICQVSRNAQEPEEIPLMNSFKGEDGGFGKPEYTIPDPEDGDGEEAAGEGAA